MKHLLFTFTICAGLTVKEAYAAITVFVVPVPYRQQSDSPFYPGLQSGSFFFEDFEDGNLNTPGVSVLSGQVREDQGVDEDDGSLDGLGRNMIWVSGNGSGPSEIQFEVDPKRGLPRYAGLAVSGFTLFPPELSTGFRINAFDANGENLGEGGIFFESVHLPPGTTYYSSDGVQFIGFHSEAGISRILLSAYRFDHLQYGWAIPEPGTAALAGLAGVLLLRRQRQTKTVSG